MTKKVPLYVLIAALALAILVTFNTTYLAINAKHNVAINRLLADYSEFDLLHKVDQIVKDNYYGEIDSDKLVEYAIRGYLQALSDPYSLYLAADEFKFYVDKLDGKSVGTGMYYIEDSNVTNGIEIYYVVPGSPADNAGIKAGDLITAIEKDTVAALGYAAAVQKIQGESGTSLTITIKRDGQEREFTCVRQEIEKVSVYSHIFADDSEVGVIRITEFNDKTPEQFKKAVSSLRESGCKKFVFDIRNNIGGELGSILAVLDYLLPEGPTAHVFYETGVEEHYDSDANCLDAPMAVLVNEKTASAAELFAAALRDYDEKGLCEATVVGVKTYGKGVLQSFFRLSNGAAFKITVGYYNPPYGDNYDGVGVVPAAEHTVELSEEASQINFNKLTDKNDNQLIAAVAVLQG